MKVSSRATNKNEIFCCSKKDVKEIFDASDIKISFGSYSRNFEADYRYCKNFKIKGKIIASLSVSSTLGQIGAVGSNGAHLNFYILKAEEFCKELKTEFVKNFLPLLFNLYEKYKNGIPGEISGVFEATVELNNNKLLLRKSIYN